MSIEQENQQKKSILIVDDEIQLLKVFELILKKHYEVLVANNGIDAIQILENGYKPGVILCDLKMPGMSGAEFLEKSINLCPSASRIFITAYSSPKEIINDLNQAKAIFYLTKPTDEIQLVQAVKIGMDLYLSNQKIRELNKKVIDLNTEIDENTLSIKTLRLDNKMLYNNSIQAISGVLSSVENFYFTPHINSVSVIVKEVSRVLKLNQERHSNLVLASLIHSVIYSGMPVNLFLNELSELEVSDKIKFLQVFQQNISNLAKYKFLSDSIQIVNQIFERYDGTGYPKALINNEISIESSILSLANLYHNLVYRLPYPDFKTYLKKGIVVMTSQELYDKHNEAIKQLYRKSSWFNTEVFNTFMEINKRKSCPALTPDVSQELVLEYKNHIELKDLFSEYDIFLDENESQFKPKKNVKEIEIDPDKLGIGMVLSRSIVTHQGVLVSKQGTRLDKFIIINIQNLYQSKLIVEKIYVEE